MFPAATLGIKNKNKEHRGDQALSAGPQVDPRAFAINSRHADRAIRQTVATPDQNVFSVRKTICSGNISERQRCGTRTPARYD